MAKRDSAALLLAWIVRVHSQACDETLRGVKSAGYQGCQTKTQSGYTCQKWGVQSPHTNEFTGLLSKWNLGNDNYCRNPDGSDTIWCYTTDPQKRWEYCSPVSFNVPRTCDETLRGVKDAGYQGCQNKTQSGYTCQKWGAQSPHTNVFTGLLSKWNLSSDNYCRNPDGSDETIWCYTTDPKKRWDYCSPVSVNVPRTCDEMLRGVLDAGYQGCQNKTRSGRTCQTWGAQSPHTNDFKGSLSKWNLSNDNYCRNPDGSGDTIWCYTTDPQVRWEYCNPKPAITSAATTAVPTTRPATTSAANTAVPTTPPVLYPARVDSCAQKVGKGIIKTTGKDCRAVGGAMNGNPGDGDWTDCHLDWCRDGYRAARVGSCSKKVAYGAITTTGKDCRAMGGDMNGYPGDGAWTACNLDWCLDGNYGAAPVGSCSNKVAYGAIPTTGKDCRAMGGNMNGNPGDADWEKCHLDWCLALPAGAVNGSSKPFPQIVMATFGYNAYYADPYPPDKESAEVMMDPGMRRPVFVLEYTNKQLTSDMRHTLPDGYRATVESGCSTSFTEKTINNEYELVVESARETGVTVGGEMGFSAQIDFPGLGKGKNGKDPDKGLKAGAKVMATGGATGTWQSKANQNQKALQNYFIIRNKATCVVYTVALDYVNFPKTHPDFQAEVNELHDNAQRHWDLFDKFGTHFLLTVSMGAREMVSSYINRTSYDVANKAAVGFAVDLKRGATVSAGCALRLPGKEGGFEYEAFKREINNSVLSPKDNETAMKAAAFIALQNRSSVGAKMPKNKSVAAWLLAVGKTPVPIKFDTRSICYHPAFSGDARSQCSNHLAGYCAGRLQAKGAICQTDKKRDCFYDQDCKADNYCRNYKCLPVPVCQVTLCEDILPGCGKSFMLESITYFSSPIGKEFSLAVDGWDDRVSAIILSRGCMKVEAVDDDGACAVNKADNGYFTKTENNLWWDLDNDVCKVAVFAYPPGSGRDRRLLALNSSSQGNILENEIIGLAEINTRLAARWHRRQALKSLQSATVPEVLGVESVSRVMEGDATLAKTHRLMQASLAENAAVDRGGNAKTEARQLQANVTYVTVDGKSYIKNIGKAMYGYNKFTGAPLSVYHAGSDPGFMHRPLWKTQYEMGTVAKVEEFTEMPRDDSYFMAAQGIEHNFTIGSSAENNTKCIRAITPHIICTSKFVNPDFHGDRVRFVVSVGIRNKTTEVCAQRLDTTCGGWKMNLQVKCRIIPLTSNYVLVNIGSMEGSKNHKCVPNPSRDISCEKEAGNPGMRTNADFANKNDAFEISSTDTQICAERKDTREPWMMELQIKCKIVNKAIDSATRRLIAGTPRQLGAGRTPPRAILVPDGWNVIMGRSTYCESQFFSKELKSTYDFKNEQELSIKIPKITVGAPIPSAPMVSVGASFQMSYESKEFVERNSNSKRKMITTKAECIDYVVEIKDLQKSPPPVDDSFKHVVDSVNGEDYYTLFSLYGLFFPRKLIFGARYGYTRYLDNMSYASVDYNKDGFSVTVGATLTVGITSKTLMSVAPGSLSVGIEMSAGVETSHSQQDIRNTSKKFAELSEEVHEFSVGQRLPADGNVSAWTELVAEEPMPIKYALESICEHPAFVSAGKRVDCLNYSATYCEKHLAVVNDGVNCVPPEQKDCLWDLDCPLAQYTCRDGTCMEPPSCTIDVYTGVNFTKRSQKYGPVYFRDYPVGIIWNISNFPIRSAAFTGGCEQVMFWDEDRCKQDNGDNMILETRRHNNAQYIPSFRYDLDEDICKITAVIKKWWVDPDALT